MSEIELLPLPEADDSVENRAQWPIVIVSDVWLQKSVQDYARAVAEHNVAAKDAEIEALRAKTAVTMGVGTGDGKLFVHGDYDSIKAAQTIMLERDRLRAEREVIAAEAVKYADKSGRLEAKVDRLAEALRRAEGLLRSAGIIAESDLERPHSIATEIKNALHDHDTEKENEM